MRCFRVGTVVRTVVAAAALALVPAAHGQELVPPGSNPPLWRVAVKPGPDKTLVFEATADGVTLKKTYQGRNRITTEIAYRGERVNIAEDGQSVLVRTPAGTARAGFGDARSDGLRRVREVLRGARPIRAFRRVVDRGEQKLRPRIDMLIATTAAAVAMLEGDGTTAARLVARIQPVRAGGVGVARTRAEEGGCWRQYEDEINRAWDSYLLCMVDHPWLPWACAARYFAWAETAWFELLSCIGLSGLMRDLA